MNVIFLDIDGVLNSLSYFKKMKQLRMNYHKHLKDKKYEVIKKMIEIDMEKLYLLKEICDRTNSKVIITSSWRKLDIYPLIEKLLIKMGLPIIGTTRSLNNRGEEIKDYLKKHSEIENYIILDDSIFPDYDEELLFHLIHTNFYTEGINEDNVEDAVYKLKR